MTIYGSSLTVLYVDVAASYQSPQGAQGESDPNNTTVRNRFVS